MRSTYIIYLASVIIALAAWPIVANSGNSAADGCWKIIPSPNGPDFVPSLGWVSVVSSNDVWASGDYYAGAVGESNVHPVSEHWDGKNWTIVPAPSVGTLGTRIQGISAVSTNDVWMVGAYDLTATNPNGVKTLTEHWNGTQWSVVASPNPLLGARGSYLRGVQALSPNDVWAVGYIVFPVAVIQTLIEHWDGTQWTIVSSPNGSVQTGLLNAVRGLAPNDVWAVGWAGQSTLITHWDGSAWTVVPSPNPSTGNNLVEDVAPIATNDVWAVGVSDSGPFTMHWDGAQWTIIPNPVASPLYGVTATAADNVWAFTRTATIHWDGQMWSVVPIAPPGSNILLGIGAAATGDVWAVGSSTLVERFANPCVAPALMPTSVVSRKTHGTVGNFDINLPLTGTPGIECRTGPSSGNHRVIVTFAGAVTVTNVTVTLGAGGTASVADYLVSGNSVYVDLTNVSNAQTLTINVLGVSDGSNAGDVHIPMNVLIGDTNGDGFVNSADIGQTKSQSGQAVTGYNFREDVNGDGFVNSADIGLVKSKSGTAIP